jgi:hypothetical protein
MSLIPSQLRENPVVISGRTVREMVAVRTVTETIPGTPATPDALGPLEYASGVWRDPASGRSYSVRRQGPLWIGGFWVQPLTGALIPITVIPGTPGTPAQTVVRDLPPSVTVGLAYVGELGGMVSVGGLSQATLANAPGAIAVTRLQNREGRIFGIPCRGVGATGPDWRPAVAALEWVETGLPWWGTVEAGARAGRWVRRSVWASGRKVRFEAGAGTTRAVGVTESGARVTAADFGAEDFLAEDWLFDEAGEPEPVDVTDWVFSGSLTAVGQRVAFAVAGTGFEPDPDPVVPGSVTVPTLIASGDFVLVSKSGRMEWEPVKDV